MQSLSCSSRFPNNVRSYPPSPPPQYLHHNIFMVKPPHHHNMSDQDDQSQALYQLFSMIVNILGSPPLPIPFPLPAAFSGTAVASSSSAPSPQVSPVGFAALFIWISMALMLFGSTIIVIGFMLMPLVIGLAMLFYLARLVSSLTYFVTGVLLSSRKIVSGLLINILICSSMVWRMMSYNLN
ncbi:hypothetical protein Hanom_Chr07g00654231 [Helianthus anomalus]